MLNIGFAIKESQIWDMAETFLKNGWMLFFGDENQYKMLNNLFKEYTGFESTFEEEHFKELIFTHFADYSTFPLVSKLIFIRKSEKLRELLQISKEKINLSYAIDFIDLLAPKIKLVNVEYQYYSKACKELLNKIREDYKLGKSLYNF